MHIYIYIYIYIYSILTYECWGSSVSSGSSDSSGLRIRIKFEHRIRFKRVSCRTFVSESHAHHSNQLRIRIKFGSNSNRCTHICAHLTVSNRIIFNSNASSYQLPFCKFVKYVWIQVKSRSIIIEFNTQRHVNVRNSYASIELYSSLVVVIIVRYRT